MGRNRLRESLLLTVMAAFVGCDSSVVPRQGGTVMDSAGVRIVHYATSAQPPRWSARLDEGLVLGGTGAGSELYRVGVALRLRDGRFAVADAGNYRVAFFDEAGTFLYSTGRQGEGPGEFQQLTLLARSLADSLVVWDRALLRISVLAPSGDFVHSLRLESTEAVPFATVSGVYNDGSFLASGVADIGSEGITAGRHSYPSPVYHFSRDGQFLDGAGLYPTGESYFEMSDGGGFSILPPLFAQTVRRLAVGTRFLFTSSARYELRFLTQNGVAVQFVRRDPRARPVTAEIRRAAVASRVADIQIDSRELILSILSEMDVPEVLPELGAVFVDGLERVWVEEYEPAVQDVSEWHVYSPDGSLLAMIDLPTRFRLTDAGTDFLLGVMTDEFGVETVVQMPLLTSAERPSA